MTVNRFRDLAALVAAAGSLCLFVGPWTPPRWSSWLAITGFVLLFAGLVALGVGRAGRAVGLGIGAAVWLGAGLATLVVTVGSDPPFGLMVAVGGLWLLPLLPVGLGFAWTFDELRGETGADESESSGGPES